MNSKFIAPASNPEGGEKEASPEASGYPDILSFRKFLEKLKKDQRNPYVALLECVSFFKNVVLDFENISRKLLFYYLDEFDGVNFVFDNGLALRFYIHPRFGKAEETLAFQIFHFAECVK